MQFSLRIRFRNNKMKHHRLFFQYQRLFTNSALTSTLFKNETKRRIAITQKWIESIVIGEKLCPFAPPVMTPVGGNINHNRKQGDHISKLRIHISHATNHDDIVNEIYAEAKLLVGAIDCFGNSNSNHNVYREKYNRHNRPETTLVVLNEEQCPSLKDFRDLVHLSWRVQNEAIVENGFENDLQIVLFHPLAKHETYSESINDDDDDDAANYTIRSPFPIIHLLREKDVLKAVDSGYKDLEGLPSRNKAKLRKHGLDFCKQKFDACFDLDSYD